MVLNLLTSATEKSRDIPVGESALFALLGFLVVVVGIAFLIAVVWLIGRAMSAKKSDSAPTPKQTAQPQVAQSLAVADAEGIPSETIAVIMAALTAYYEKTNPKCEFTVKRIKRF